MNSITELEPLMRQRKTAAGNAVLAKTEDATVSLPVDDGPSRHGKLAADLEQLGGKISWELNVLAYKILNELEEYKAVVLRELASHIHMECACARALATG